LSKVNQRTSAAFKQAVQLLEMIRIVMSETLQEFPGYANELWPDRLIHALHPQHALMLGLTMMPLHWPDA